MIAEVGVPNAECNKDVELIQHANFLILIIPNSTFRVPQLKIFSFLCIPNKNDLVAQPVEQLTLNQWVESSILSQVT